MADRITIVRPSVRKVTLQLPDRNVSVGVPIQAGQVGEANTAANVGTGAGVFRDKTGNIINLRSLVGIGGISTTVNGDDLEIGAAQWIEDEFTPTAGQVTFIASNIPVDPVSVEFYVNGILQDDDVDYSRSGATFTWLGTTGPLDAEDKVLIRYK